MLYFNPRSHAGSDNSTSARTISGLLFQSTLPRGERLTGSGRSSSQLRISIHAPTRGATKSAEYVASITDISIHAPTRGATWHASPQRIMFEFQSTLPRGERLEYAAAKGGIVIISIHAPTRGATCTMSSLRCWRLYFNPRSHAGSDIQLQYLGSRF